MSAPRLSAPEPWAAAERQMLVLARRAVLRALHRPILVAGLAGLATALAVLMRLAIGPSYEATLSFRVDEGDLGDGVQAPRLPGDVRDYIASVALSSQELEKVMRKNGLSLGRLARDREGAIESFREDVSITLSRDDFVYVRRPGDPPRSAHVAISLLGPDPEQALSILRDLGELILSAQASQRSGNLAAAGAGLRQQLEAAQAKVKQLHAAVGRAWVEAPRAKEAPGLGAQARIVTLEAQYAGAVDQVLFLERRLAGIEFSQALERRQLGLSFTPYDESVTTRRSRLTFMQVARRTILTLLMAAVLAAVLVGAFDDRIYHPDDLAARGLAVFGALPRFPGDEVESYRARSARGA